MAIRFSCTCGRSIVVKNDALSGKMVECPACQTVLVVPAPEPSAAGDDAEVIDLSAEVLAPASAGAAAPAEPAQLEPAQPEPTPSEAPAAQAPVPTQAPPPVVEEDGAEVIDLSDEAIGETSTAELKCEACGAEVPPGTMFCPACGAKVEIGPKLRVQRTPHAASRCPKCSVVLPDGAVICTECGFNLDTGKVMRTASASRPSSMGTVPRFHVSPVTIGIIAALVLAAFGISVVLKRAKRSSEKRAKLLAELKALAVDGSSQVEAASKPENMQEIIDYSFTSDGDVHRGGRAALTGPLAGHYISQLEAVLRNMSPKRRAAAISIASDIAKDQKRADGVARALAELVLKRDLLDSDSAKKALETLREIPATGDIMVSRFPTGHDGLDRMIVDIVAEVKGVDAEDLWKHTRETGKIEVALKGLDGAWRGGGRYAFDFVWSTATIPVPHKMMLRRLFGNQIDLQVGILDLRRSKGRIVMQFREPIARTAEGRAVKDTIVFSVREITGLSGDVDYDTWAPNRGRNVRARPAKFSLHNLTHLREYTPMVPTPKKVKEKMRAAVMKEAKAVLDEEVVLKRRGDGFEGTVFGSPFRLSRIADGAPAKPYELIRVVHAAFFGPGVERKAAAARIGNEMADDFVEHFGLCLERYTLGTSELRRMFETVRGLAAKKPERWDVLFPQLLSLLKAAETKGHVASFVKASISKAPNCVKRIEAVIPTGSDRLDQDLCIIASAELHIDADEVWALTRKTGSFSSALDEIDSRWKLTGDYDLRFIPGPKPEMSSKTSMGPVNEFLLRKTEMRDCKVRLSARRGRSRITFEDGRIAEGSFGKDSATFAVGDFFGLGVREVQYEQVRTGELGKIDFIVTDGLLKIIDRSIKNRTRTGFSFRATCERKLLKDQVSFRWAGEDPMKATMWRGMIILTPVAR